MPTKRLDLTNLNNYIFGSTSAIITNISLIVGLGSSRAGKLPVLGALLTIALADNISDALGIHLDKEAEGYGTGPSLLTMSLNFLARLVISLSFIALVLLYPLALAGSLAIAWGLLLLLIISFVLARRNRANPWWETTKHLLVAVCVIVVSHFVGLFLARYF